MIFFKEQHNCNLEEYPSSGNGNGFKLGGRGTLHNITLDNCVAFNNKHCGFTKNCNAGRIDSNSCVSSKNEDDFSLHDNMNRIIAKNCISTNDESLHRYKKQKKKNININIYG